MTSRLAALLAALLMFPLVALPGAVSAAPGDAYHGPYFGDGNLPPGCLRDMSLRNEANDCYHMRTDLNALDSPQVDVLIVAPVSPTTERDMRIMRQSIEMWEGGLQYLAEQMDLDWLADGIDFHVTVQAIDPHTGEMGEFTTYPVYDPEIVVIATNPVGGIGIGIDPVDFSSEIINIFGPDTSEDEVPCHSIENPLDFEYWDSLPGFDNHHGRSGTYVEDCGGAGGNVCFAVNGAIDPEPSRVDFFQLFDLVSHEVGHCLTLGHVGDGAEGDWGAVPINDIMAYDEAPHGLTKCVSTLDVETFATRMSKYLDVNGDGTPGDHTPFADGGDLLTVNDVPGDGRNPFQVQHPRDHRYASSTGSPYDCPQPDTGLVPGTPTDWTPEPVATSEPRLSVTDSAMASGDTYRVAGLVEHASLINPPAYGSAAVTDPAGDASTPTSDLTALNVDVTETAVIGTLHVDELWPDQAPASGVSYSLVIDGRQFDSYLHPEHGVRTYDNASRAAVDGFSAWDAAGGTVTFTVPRAYLAEARIEAPYDVVSQTNLTYTGARETYSLLRAGQWIDDRAPNPDTPIVIDGPEAGEPSVPGPIQTSRTFTITHEGTFTADESQHFIGDFLTDSHHYFADLIGMYDATATLDWVNEHGDSDLDLYVTGAVNSGNTGATADKPEVLEFTDVRGALDLEVAPWLILEPLGVDYVLTLEVTCKEDCDKFDTDKDGLLDVEDVCPTVAGTLPNGCPPPSGTVDLYVDGALVESQPVSTYDGPSTFDFTTPVTGAHTLRVVWVERGEVLAEEVHNVERDSDGDGVPDSRDVCPGFDDTEDADGDGTPDGCDTGEPANDRDGDGVDDSLDNCPKAANADQADMDGDGEGDSCDKDIDGDGHHNKKEEAHGSDPRDPDSTPTKGKKPAA